MGEIIGWIVIVCLTLFLLACIWSMLKVASSADDYLYGDDANKQDE